MNIDPLSTALKEIVETRAMVETLVVSSEEFDYANAKRALRDLSGKVRALAKTQAQFAALLKARQGNICVVDFRNTSAPRNAQKS